MDYLTPEFLRVLKPGRVAAIHVKDRVLFGNSTGTGMPTIEPFHALCVEHYMKHGFQYFGMITVATDVVRENNQTYRLGWTDRSKAYADEPMEERRRDCVGKKDPASDRKTSRSNEYNVGARGM